MNSRKDINRLPEYSAGRSRKGAIKLSSNENPLGTSPCAITAFEQSIGELNLYPQSPPMELCSAIARWKGVETKQVICGNGSNAIFKLCAAAFIESGGNAIGSKHSFSQYCFATRLFGGEFREISTRSDLSFDLEAMVSAVDKNTGIVFLCSPNNPTGLIIPQDELEWALETISQDVLIVIDQAYGEYANPSTNPNAKELLRKFPNCILTGTFSKIFGLAALRIGYGLASPELIRLLHRVQSPFTLTQPSIAAALAAIEDRKFVEQSLVVNRESKQLLCNELRDMGIGYLPSEANFLCIENYPAPAGNKLATTGIAEVLEINNIITRNLGSFGLDNYFRLTIPDLWLAEEIVFLIRDSGKN